jgi:hypothetical protein
VRSPRDELSQVPPPPGTGGGRRGRGWRVFWRLFRWCRIAVLLLVLVLVALGLFFYTVGLPESAKARVVATLREHGWEVEFSRLRLRWYRGIIADHLHIQRVGQVEGPHLFVDEAEGRLNFEALKDFRLDVTALALRGGRLLLPLPDSHRPRQTVCLNDIHGEVRFISGDVWDLYSIDADCRGTRLLLSGTLTNASALRDWKAPPITAPASTALLEWRRRIWSAFQQIRFSRAPGVAGHFRADVRDPSSLVASLRLITEGLASPWGASTNLRFTASLAPAPGVPGQFQVRCRLSADEVHGGWGRAANLDLRSEFQPPLEKGFPTNAELDVKVSSAETAWGKSGFLSLGARLSSPAGDSAPRLTEVHASLAGLQADGAQAATAQIRARLDHPATNWLPGSLMLDIEAIRAGTRWGTASWGSGQVLAHLPMASQFGLLNTNLTWPDRLRTLPLDSALVLSNLATPRLAFDRISLTNRWRSPSLICEGNSSLLGGAAQARVSVDSETREVRFQVSTDVDPHKIRHLLATNHQEILGLLTWQTPPRIEAQGRLIWPAWSGPRRDWAREVWPTSAVRVGAQVGSALFRGVAVDAAALQVGVTNDVWEVSDLRLVRPEGQLWAQGVGDGRTGDFRCRLRSTVNPQEIVRPTVSSVTARRLLDDFQWTAPPVIEASAWGNWREWSRLGFSGQFAGTNFTFRNEAIQDCVTGVTYSNQFLSFLGPQIQRTGERGRAEGIGVNLDAELLYLTNAWGNLSPYAITRAIGPHTVAAIAPYVFARSPTGHAWGVIDLIAATSRSDAHFELRGGPFRWDKYHFDQIEGQVDWRGETVTLTNVQGAFHGGRLAGNVFLDYSPTNGTIVAFTALLTNVDLHRFVADVSSRTNQIEGTLNGTLVITDAQTAFPLSWQGYGEMGLTNGLIWDIPLFGFFSPILNGFVPGLGNSRAKRASATFSISNSVIHSRNLQIHATGMRMQYALDVDFDHRVQGRVEAELLRDMPGLGLIISKIFWPVTKLFEYKLSGTLEEPKAVPVFFVPRILLLPFRPIKTLKEMLPEAPAPAPGPPPAR